MTVYKSARRNSFQVDEIIPVRLSDEQANTIMAQLTIWGCTNRHYEYDPMTGKQIISFEYNNNDYISFRKNINRFLRLPAGKTIEVRYYNDSKIKIVFNNGIISILSA